MASRAEQKAVARAAREAAHRELSAAHARRMRLIWLGGVVAAAALVIVVVAIAVGGGSSSTGSAPAKAAVGPLLAGIQQSGNTIGNPKAPVTVTEFGDLVCPICQNFALNAEARLIANDVRAGRVKLVYRGLETASSTANAGEYIASQVAARAAGLQHRAWNFILLWYHEQGSETTPYVTDGYMQNIAQQVPGLNLATWQSDRGNQALTNAVNADSQAANAVHFIYTPSITITGPKGSAQPIIGAPSYSQLESAITSVG